ncbi:CC0125/CC1285 family lipoprotein [Alteromonas sp. ASW11-130]|uniref:CC0125/CC1285 family lipoprotein n=1 Tax=Alteromonas sp. ASW11-130 TaxID=3015775 RepID=UPI002242161C|nr:hypothetical protein [Alteromonas sp. ASW11-130]MCW8090286.1 hypothetical protein [Alteromonas sp. ASW11-130]
MLERKSITHFTYFLSSAIFVLTLSLACTAVPSAVPTPYKAAVTPDGYGYSSSQLSNNEYRIKFKATEKTSADIVQEYALRRAAELARQYNYDWVTIVKTDVEKKQGHGKTVVRSKQNNNIKVFQDQQCTMSGCEEVAQPFVESEDDIEVRNVPMSNIHYSMIVRMSQTKPGSKAFNVHELLNPND